MYAKHIVYKHYIFTIPGVAKAVLQTALSSTDWLIQGFTDPFPPNLVVYTTKLLRLNNRCHLCVHALELCPIPPASLILFIALHQRCHTQ